MQRISAEQFKKKYGDQMLSQVQAPTRPQEPSYLERVGGGLKNVFSGLKSDLGQQADVLAQQELQPRTTQQALKTTGALARSGLRTAGAVVQAAFTPVLEAPGIKQATEFAGQKLAETPVMQRFTEWTQRHPEAAKDIMNTLDVGGLFGAKAVSTPLAAGVARTGQSVLKTTSQLTQKGIATAGTNITSVGEYTASRLPKLLGIFSGENDDVIKQALINPKVANIGIEQGDDAIRAAVREGSTNAIKIKNVFVQAHAQAKNEILGNYGKVVIPKNNVKGIFNDLLKKNDVSIGSEGLDFSTSKIVANPGEISKIKAAWDGLANWKQFNLSSIDDYKQFVGRLRRFADEAGIPSKSPFLGQLYHELDNLITKRKNVPIEIRNKYTTLNKNFADQIELYDDIVDAFNSGDPFTKLANALGKNRDTLRQTLEFYEKRSGKSVLPIVAGRELAMEKTAAFGFLNPRSWIDLLISPKAQAKVVTKIGSKFPKAIKTKGQQ